MISKNVENMIPKIQQFFGSQPIKKAWLFGSCSRGEESMDSDVDILVEYIHMNTPLLKNYKLPIFNYTSILKIYK